MTWTSAGSCEPFVWTVHVVNLKTQDLLAFGTEKEKNRGNKMLILKCGAFFVEKDHGLDEFCQDNESNNEINIGYASQLPRESLLGHLGLPTCFGSLAYYCEEGEK